MKRKQERKVEDCPFCEVPVIFRKYSDFSKHLESCPRLGAQQELLANYGIKENQHRGPLMTKAMTKVCQNIINYIRLNADVNRKKFTDEWKRIDDHWKDEMIVCPKCYTFKFPADERLHECPKCAHMMGWAKELVENDPRFNFAKEFCAGD